MPEVELSTERESIKKSSRSATCAPIAATPSRRQLLHLLGAGSVASFAGCAGSDQKADQAMQQSGASATVAFAQPVTRSGTDQALRGGIEDAGIPVHEKLTAVTPDFDEIVPELATEWEATDETTWKFTIRDGVKFHNGEILTAEVAAESLRTILEAEGWEGSNIEKLSVDDKRTLIIETTRPFPQLPANLAHGGWKLQYWGDKDVGEAGPIGTGPFQVEDASSMLPAGEPIQTTAFDDYWGDDPLLDELVIKAIVDGNSRSLALKSGDVDVAHNLPKQRFKPFQESEDIIVRAKTEPRIYWAAFNIHKSPTDDEKLRLALEYAVDQQSLVENIIYGIGEPAKSPFSNAIEWSAHDELPAYGPDMDRAQELVEESNYDGEELSIMLMDGNASDRQIAQRMQEKFSKLGVNLTLKVVDRGVLYTKWKEGTFNLHLAHWGPGGGSAEYLIYGLFHSKGWTNRQLHQKNGTGVTWMGKEMDQLIEKGYYNFDKEERYGIYRDIMHRIMDAGVVIPLYYFKNILGTRADIKGPELHAIPDKIDYTTLGRK